MTLYKRQNSITGSTNTSKRNSPRESAVEMNPGSRGGSVAGFVSDESRSAIAASALGKLVFKDGRKTIAPEIMLKASGLLPPRPTETTEEIHDKLAGAQIKANNVEIVEKQVTPVKVMQAFDEIETSDS
jgi:hypothetical protein